MGRNARVERKTAETEVEVELDLDGCGNVEISTGIPFLDHLLESFGYHGLFDLKVRARGDLNRGDHHTVEDVAISIGECFSKALGDKKRICRFGSAMVPMDEALATVALDLSGRGYFVASVKFRDRGIGGLTLQNSIHFLDTLCRTMGMNLHARVEGDDDHHKLEALFKALGVALKEATRIEERRKGIPSVKGTL